MRRTLIPIFTIALISLGAVPAFPQDRLTDTGTGTVEQIAAGTLEVTEIRLSIDGRAVAAAPPGVHVTLTLTLRNGGDQTVRGVGVSLSAPDGVDLTQTEEAIEEIAPGATADKSVDMLVDPDACVDFIGIGGDATHEGGTSPLKLSVPASCPGPRLSIDSFSFEGGDGDDLVEPGETLRVFIALQNDGRDVAKDVRGSIRVSGDAIRVARTTLEWGDIATGTSKKNASPLIVEVADDAPRQKGCEGGPGPEIRPLPAVDGGPTPPDTVVSSDENAPSTVARDAAPDAEPSGSAEPGSTGGGEPGSTGTDGTATEPAPPAIDPATSTITPQPNGAPTTEPEIDPTTEPGPKPTEPAPNPEPADTTQPVALQVLLSVTAGEYETVLEYSNQIFCALERGAPASAEDTRREAVRNRGATAAPILLAFGVSVVAVAVRRAFVP